MELYTLNIASVGKRGRPAHPKPHAVIHEQVLNHKRVPLGELVLEPNSNGSVTLKAVVNGKAKVFTFPVKTGKAVAIPTTTYNKSKTTKKPTVRKATTRKPVKATRGPGRPKGSTNKTTAKAGVKVFVARTRAKTTK